jgi:hypothetical protein
MFNMHDILVTSFVFAVTFLVPTVVWMTLTAGLFQLIYGKVHRVGDGLPASRKLAQRSVQ